MMPAHLTIIIDYGAGQLRRDHSQSSPAEGLPLYSVHLVEPE